MATSRFFASRRMASVKCCLGGNIYSASSTRSQRHRLHNGTSSMRCVQCSKWVVKEGRVPDNPTLGVEREKVKTAGYPTWSEVQIARFEERYPVGTKERLAFGLLLYTGQRLAMSSGWDRRTSIRAS